MTPDEIERSCLAFLTSPPEQVEEGQDLPPGRQAVARSSRAVPRLLPERLKVAWRVAREVAFLQGWLTRGEPMCDLLEREESEEDPRAFFARAPDRPRPQVIPDADAARRELDHTLPLEPLPRAGLAPEDVRRPPDARRWLLRAPLLPPPQGESERDPRAMPRARWMAVVRPVSARLPLCRSQEEGEAWSELFQDDALGAWPSPDEIVRFEEKVIHESLRKLARGGYAVLSHHCREEWGLSGAETNGLMEMVRARARHYTSADVEEKRAMMELRLDDLAERCRAAEDLRAEIMAVKALAVVQGVTRLDPEDIEAEFVKVVRQTASRPPQRVLDAPSPRADQLDS